jgi:hypothetical protein
MSSHVAFASKHPYGLKSIRMKRLTFSFTVLLLAFIWIYHTAATDFTPAINPIIGDISYVKKFSQLPSPYIDYDLRIRTHLAYAEMILRNTETSYLSPEIERSRLKLLGHLHEYWTNGKFPDRSGLKRNENPCFIDNLGRISAVGYLIERSREQNSQKRKKMSDDDFYRWILNNGFTKEEVAIIQPSYDRKLKS